MTNENQPTDAVDPRANAESRLAEDTASQTGSRSGDSAPAPVPAPAAGQTPDELDKELGTPAGTSGGDPLAGVKISDKDLAESVPGDEGPEHPGERR